MQRRAKTTPASSHTNPPACPRAGSRRDDSATDSLVIDGASRSRQATAGLTVRFGSVVVNAASPRQLELRRNVEAGRAALARAASRIVKAGVTLASTESVPLYRADPHDPSLLIRELNGKVSRGVIVDGKFKVSTKR